MREWTVGPEAEGKRLDRYLAARLGGVPAGALQKYLRLGRVKRNTRRASASDRLCAGDTLQLRSAMREEPFVLRVHEVFLELEGNKRDPFLEWIQRRFRSVILVTEETAHQTV